jgi:hypothetical protein
MLIIPTIKSAKTLFRVNAHAQVWNWHKTIPMHPIHPDFADNFVLLQKCVAQGK